jgi:hypothetical protein
MQIDGLHPNGAHGPDSASRSGKGVSGPRKGDGKAEGKSFADALGKAKAAAGPQPASQAPAPPPGTGPADAPPPEMGSQGSHIDLIRMRLQTGYYNTHKVDDALSEKLSDYFDDAV